MTHFVVALAVIINHEIQCSPVEDLKSDTFVQSDDISAAIDHLHQRLPAQVTLTDKCKRYAVTASHLKPKIRPYSMTVSHVLNMPQDRLDKFYQELAAKNRLGALYMAAIDGLRATSCIGPAFLELVKCLKLLKDPSLQKYLDDEELNIILRLYRSILESANSTVQLDLIPGIDRLRQGFILSLINMFRDHIENDSEVYKNLVRTDIAGADSAIRPEGMSEAESMEISERTRQRLEAHRHREHEILNRRRMRILYESSSQQGPQQQRQRKPRLRCAGIAQAIVDLYEHFLGITTFADRCKRYAVFTSLAKPRARVHETAAHRVLCMSEDDSDESYQSLAANNELGSLYMSAIDSFRAASLIGPAFVELVDCLKQIEDPSARVYLEDGELKMILELYRHALESPDTMVPECAISRLRQGFVVRLEDFVKESTQYRTDSNQTFKCDVDAPKRLVREEEMTRSERHQAQKERKRLRSKRVRLLSRFPPREEGRPQEHELNSDLADITKVIDHLYDLFLDQMTLIDRCKRYAVSISYFEGRVHKGVVSGIVSMPEDRLDQLYRGFAANDQLGGLYMTAIDEFRAASVIGPAFLELIECLKQLNDPSLRIYLDDEELNIILRVYRHILEAPDAKIDFDQISGSNKLRERFFASLMEMFKGHIRYNPVSNRALECGSGASSSQQQVWNEEIIESERRDMRRKERRMLRDRRERLLSRSSSQKKDQLRQEHNPKSKCVVVTEAINHLYEHLLDQLTLIDRCKRYAVAVSYIGPTGRLNKRAVSGIVTMPEDRLNQLYQRFAANDQLGGLYMTAIDEFRAASVIGPVFIELIECLKQLNDPSLRIYLDDEELKIILRVYRHIIEAPDAKIDFNHTSIRSGLRHRFVVSLKNSFEDHLRHPPVSQEFGLDSEASYSEQPVESGRVTDPESREIRRKKQKRLSAHRNRERKTLRARRSKILSASLSPKKTSSRLEHDSETKGIAQRDRLQHFNLSALEAHQQRQQQQLEQSPTDRVTAQFGPPRSMIEVPVQTAPSYNEGRSVLPPQAHQNEQLESLVELLLSSPTQTYDRVAFPSDHSQTRCVAGEMIDQQSQSFGTVHRMIEPTRSAPESPDAFVESLLVASPEAGNANDPDQLDVDDYDIYDFDLIDQSNIGDR